MQKKLVSSIAGALALLGLAPGAQAAVEYVRVCSLYGAGFHYIAGTDICMNEWTGDSRQQTEGGTWRSLLPYPEGSWVTDLKDACGTGKVVKVGTYKSTDFTANTWQKKQTPPANLKLKPGEFVTKVMMSGGFYDPRLPGRHGTNGTNGLCVRSIDPNLLEAGPNGSFNPPWGNGMLPVGCIANSRIVNMPGTYAISATAAHPSIDVEYYDANQTLKNGPVTYGTQVVVTTDLGNIGSAPYALTYTEAAHPDVVKPMAGQLEVNVCVDQGGHGPGDAH